MKIEKNTEFNDLQELRREVAIQELEQTYDRNKHIEQVKNDILKNLQDRIPIKLTQEIIDLGLLDWFQETCIQWEGFRLLERLMDKENYDDNLNSMGFYTFEFGT